MNMYNTELGAGSGKENGVSELQIFENQVFGQRKPEAKFFKRWITHEVIPAIRKHGAYMTDSVLQQVMENPEAIYTLAEQLLATGRFDEQPVIANPAEELDTDNTGAGAEDEEPEAPENGAGAGAGVEDGLTASKVSQMRNADLLALAEEKNISLEGCSKHDEYVERINGVLGLVDFSKLGLE